MSTTPEFTTVIGVDAKTLPQLRVSAPTWARYRPEMFDQPWLVFYDREQVTIDTLRDTLAGIGCGRRRVRAIGWPLHAAATYATQRERMLTGFVHATRYVETPWWLKVDTDALALRPADWLPASWFAQDPTTAQKAPGPGRTGWPGYAPGYYVWIASPWGYTKPADQMATLDDWGDAVDDLAAFPRLEIPYTPGGRRARHPRMASWLSFYRSDWTRFASELALHYCGPDRIPVPSQDGYHFYIARRRGDRYLRTQMRRLGWTNRPRLAGLQETAARAITGAFER
jgi:hypothetical protein